MAEASSTWAPRHAGRHGSTSTLQVEAPLSRLYGLVKHLATPAARKAFLQARFNFIVNAEHGQPDKSLFRKLKPREPLTTQSCVQYYMRFCQELCAKYGVCKDCHQVDLLCTCSSTRPNQYRPKRDRAANQANAAARTRANQQRMRQSAYR